MSTYVSDAVVLAKVKNLLKKAGSATIPTAVSGNITAYNQKAYDEIIAALTGRGFSAANVAGWDRGAEFNTDLACWWAITDAGVTESFDDRELTKLDRRPELKNIQVTVGGVLVSITAVETVTDYGNNQSYGNKYAFGPSVAFDATRQKYLPDKYKPVRITDFEG